MISKKWEILFHILTVLILITVIYTIVDQFVHIIGLWTLWITVPVGLVSLVSFTWGLYTVTKEDK